MEKGWWKSASRIGDPKRTGTPIVFNAKIKGDKYDLENN